VTQANTRYQALYQSLSSRQRRKPAATGLDKLAVVTRLRFTQRRITLAWLRAQAEQIDVMAPELRHHTDAALAQRIEEIREVFLRNRQDDAAVRRGLGVVREVARRETGEEPYLVQLMGALAMYHSCIIEMLTGEGKTLTASTVAPLLAWRYKHLHVFTVNDYLAKRDAEGRKPIFRRLGLECGAIEHEVPQEQRAEVYALPIIYGTPKQIVADYLRDQIRLGPTTSAWTGMRELGGGSMAMRAGSPASGPIVPGLKAAMIDEADGVLIDEAVVPLIIAQSRRGDDMEQIYRTATDLAERMTIKVHFAADLLRRKVELTSTGREHAAAMMRACPDPIWRATRRGEELIRQALVAKYCYGRGRQYAVVDGRVQIIDEFTGRIMADRSWEHGLHQAVEAKEKIEISADRETIARMSFQRFFRMYPVMCGMTGTAVDAKGELERVFQRRVLVIPPNRPVARAQLPLQIFRTSAARWGAVVAEIEHIHLTGRPVLVGTRSVEASELVARELEARNIDHKVLNAVQDKEEATLIAKAGQRGAVTVATNMAGRGTDIKLEMDARKRGGLHVILTEMHASARIDRQFIGRAGRQGDAGSYRLMLSLQDELVGLFARRLSGTLAKLTTASGENPLRGQWLAVAKQLFRLCQKRAERRDRNLRGEVLRQDDWVEKHLPGM